MRPDDASRDLEQTRGSSGQSIAVALASALVLFTVVGLIASRTPAVQMLSAQAVSRNDVAFAVADSQRSALQPVSLSLQVHEAKSSGLTDSFALTVPAGRAVLLDAGLPPLCPGAGTAIWIPPLAPGRHVLSVGLHDIVVDAVGD